MKYFDYIKFPAMALKEESVYREADELLKSHFYSAKTALLCMDHERFMIWLDYDFCVIKEKAKKNLLQPI